MKKIIILLLTLSSVLLLGACAPSDDATEIELLEERINILELQMVEVEDILINIGIIEGLNGEREYYIIPNNYTTSDLFQSVSASEIEILGNELDKTKAPSYVLDELGNYIPFEDVAQLLIDKYFGDLISLTSATVGIQVDLRIDNKGISQSDYMARMILLIEELSNYEFYIIGSTQISIQTDFGGTSWITIPIQTLRSDFITITPYVVYMGLYEIDVYNMVYLDVVVQSIYDGFITDGVFNGFVLNLN